MKRIDSDDEADDDPDVPFPAGKRSTAALLCQALFPPFTENRRTAAFTDNRHRRTVPVNAAVFFLFPTGPDPGGNALPLFNRRKPEKIENTTKGR